MAGARRTSPGGMTVNPVMTMAENGVGRSLRRPAGMIYHVEGKTILCVMNVSKQCVVL